MKKYIVFALAIAFMAQLKATEKPVYNNITLSDNWKIQSSAVVNQTGAELSKNKKSPEGWYTTNVPTTVMGALTSNGEYKNALEGTTYKSLDKTRFEKSWYFMNEFEMPKLSKSQSATLIFDGVSYRANVWLNGKQIADTTSFYGTFRIHKLDISKYAKKKNILVVEVFKARAGEPNIGFADWNPRPLDENMGLYREVHLKINDIVDMEHSTVKTKVNTETCAEAWLSIETTLTNKSTKSVSGELKIDYEGKNFTFPVSIEPKATKTVTLSPNEIEWLYVKNPRLWWCRGLGEPNMHTMNIAFKTGDKISDSETITFGIRDIKDYMTEEGHKGFILNGRKVLLKGAGWTDDIFLRDNATTNEIQARYVADMNLNTIRFENIWGTSQNIYDLCDRMGLMMMVGWSCQWEWEHLVGMPCDKFGGIKSEKDMQLIADSFKDQVLWLRNHPSIIGWALGSDKLPRPELEKKYLKVLGDYHQIPYIGSCKKMNSEVTGPSGTKMAGPYEYVGPNYWYSEKAPGGAFGFNTETGIGAQLPVKESIERMIPADKLWPINEAWSYHCTNGTGVMDSLDALTKAITSSYGEATNLDDYLRKADLLNYEGTKAMFEAFRANVPRATGVIQWMLNSAWPSFYWQLYDNYLVPTSAYYSVKKGNMPQQLIYDYVKKNVSCVNESETEMKMKAHIAIFNLEGKKISESSKDIVVAPDQVINTFDVPAVTDNAIMLLKLTDKDGKEISNNCYTLSSTSDEYNWAKSNWLLTPITKYANFSALAKMPGTDCLAHATVSQSRGSSYIEVTLENNQPTVAFMINMKAKYDNGDIIVPAYWSDNYVTLAPGEKRTYTCIIPEIKTNDGIFVDIAGWNIKPIEIKIKR